MELLSPRRYVARALSPRTPLWTHDLQHCDTSLRACQNIQQGNTQENIDVKVETSLVER